jgi:hypothetical protein
MTRFRTPSVQFSVALSLLISLSHVAAAAAGDSLHLTATNLGGNMRIIGRYQVVSPGYCPARRPAPGTPDYKRWSDPRCVPYISQHAEFRVTVRYKGRSVHSEAFGIDGPNWDPTKGGVFSPYYIYCGLLSSAPLPRRGRTYNWKVRLIDPFHRSDFDASQAGTFTCG